MKRIIALLLALVLVLSLAACGKEAEKSAAPDATEAPVETTQAVDEGKPVTLGRVENGVYTNEYIGIGCALDSAWTFKTAEELQELPAQVQELLQDTEYADASLRQFTDMMAENVDAMVNMNVQYTQLSLQERIAYAALSSEALVDLVMKESASMAEAYAQAGIEGAVMEKVSIKFLGQDRYGVYTSASVQGYPYYMLQIFDYGLGRYGVTITVASFFEDNTGAMLDLFYALD